MYIGFPIGRTERYKLEWGVHIYICVYIDIYISWGLLVGNEGTYSIGIRKGLSS